MSDQDVTFGPGTDLVISLFAVSLLLVGLSLIHISEPTRPY